jgi:hypothetical protein
MIAQFGKHIKAFKNAPRNQEREYEHWAWVARQHQVFGELLDHMGLTTSGVPGLQHPGYYYHAAASYTAERRKQAKRILGLASHEKLQRYVRGVGPTPPPIYFGQESSTEGGLNLF